MVEAMRDSQPAGAWLLNVTQALLLCPSNAQYIVSGSDDGSFFIWEKETTNLVRVLQGDESIVNCL